jgi:putative GTP pyrophosphokinase
MELNLSDGDIKSWEEVQLLYNSALKQINTKIEILNDEFQEVHRYNPIEHTKSRIKTPESIVKKLKRHGYDSTLENMVRYVNDIAGIRIICSFTSDIYKIAEMISTQDDITVLSVKDYIVNPKPSGYKSYHLIVTVPVYLSSRCDQVKVEIQIRTVAMDFWASLEHKIRYKKDLPASAKLEQELLACAEMSAALESRMAKLQKTVDEYIDSARSRAQK